MKDEVLEQFYRLFTSPMGDVVLTEIYKRAFGQDPLGRLDAKDGQAMAISMAMQAGEQGLYRWIVSMKEKGETLCRKA